MSRQAVDHHRRFADQYEHAAMHHRGAATVSSMPRLTLQRWLSTIVEVIVGLASLVLFAIVVAMAIIPFAILVKRVTRVIPCGSAKLD